MNEATAKKPVPNRRKVQLDPRLAAYKGVWVFIEHERGLTHPVSWELLGEGRKLADKLGVELAGVLLGAPDPALTAVCREAFSYGANLCYLIEDPILADYRNEPYTKGLTDLVNKYQPEILMLGATTLGRDLAGSIATTLATGLTADCTELNIDLESRSLAATRPTFGGSLLCTIQTLNYRPQMATVRPRVMQLVERDATRSGRIIEGSLGMVESTIITKVLEFIPDEQQSSAQLAYADIIVSGGRGLKRPENFQLVWDLAKVLGAEVGATRPLVQAGWVAADRQVGQTGKKVAPDLYLAIAINGASQHLAGISEAKNIAAINIDPDAPIFKHSRFGLVGDYRKVVPLLRERVAALCK